MPCGSSLCKQVTIVTKDGSIAPTGIQTSNNNFCTGGSATLSVAGGQLGTGANWSWYESACSSNFLFGTGSSISVTLQQQLCIILEPTEEIAGLLHVKKY